MNRRGFIHTSAAIALSTAFPINRGFAAILSGSGRVDSDVNAITGNGAQVTLKRAAVQELGDALRGNLLLPGHAAYERARLVRNPSISKFPALIVQPKGVADIKDAVDFARESSLLVSVKCGGHSPSGKSTCNGGMMIDLSLLRSTRVDPNRRIAHVSGGSWLGDMDHDTMKFGLVTTAGTVSHTGVGGLTLGGGFGRLARRFGLALDNVRGVELVTADGNVVRAYPDENPELYWGVRGGGGNFGVVANFEFQLHQMDRQVIGGNIGFPLNEAKQLLNFYADYTEAAPDELYTHGGLITSPDGFNGVLIHVCYSGDKSRADKVLEPLRKAGTVVFDNIRPVDYVTIQKSGDTTDQRVTGSYLKSGFVEKITPALVDAVVDGMERHPERGAVCMWQQNGGAINRIAPDATAFSHRSVNYDTLVTITYKMGVDPAPHIQWLRDYFATIEPHTYGFYANDIMEKNNQNTNRNYQDNYKRLVTLKNKYDPANLFRLNANITPEV